MTSNKFEAVQSPVSDAMSLMLFQKGADAVGQIVCPSSAAPGRLPKDFRGAEMPLKDAFRAAIKFANDFKVPMVVHDPDGLWQAEWGKLYRDEDNVEASVSE